MAAGEWVTVESVPRRADQELRDLARGMITHELLVTNDPDAIRCAFLILTLMPPFTEEARQAIGAFIGDNRETMGRSLNGWPVFSSVRFLHRDDLPVFNEHLARMRAALA